MALKKYHVVCTSPRGTVKRANASRAGVERMVKKAKAAGWRCRIKTRSFDGASHRRRKARK